MKRNNNNHTFIAFGLMNNSFSIRRFGLLLRHDVRRLDPRLFDPKSWNGSNSNFNSSMSVGYGHNLLGMILFPIVMTLFNYLLNLNESEEGADLLYRFIFIIMWSFTVGMMTPFYHYGFAAKKKSGLYFAMLPASKSEKYWAIMLMSGILIPLAMLVCTTTLDSLIALLNIGPWKGFIWQFEELNLIKPMDWLCMITCYPLLIAGFVGTNGLSSKALRIVLPIIIFVYGLIGLFLLPLVSDTLEFSITTYWIVIILQVLMCLLIVWAGKRTLDRKSY